jgi:hypothetical protein
VPCTAHQLTLEFSIHSCCCCLRRSLNLDPFGSKYKPLDALHRATLLIQYRVQINFTRDIWRGVECPRSDCRVLMGVPTESSIVAWLCLRRGHVTSGSRNFFATGFKCVRRRFHRPSGNLLGCVLQSRQNHRHPIIFDEIVKRANGLRSLLPTVNRPKPLRQ